MGVQLKFELGACNELKLLASAFGNVKVAAVSLLSWLASIKRSMAGKDPLNLVFARRAYALFVKLDFESGACSKLKL